VTAFFDTNILIYATQDGRKARIARDLIARPGAISVQVLNEFVSVSRRKLGFDWTRIHQAATAFLLAIRTCRDLTMQTHLAARDLCARHQLSFYDALILASALEAGAETLYTEDMQSGRVIDGLRIVNPFAEAPSGGTRPEQDAQAQSVHLSD
jgi:predicted nucleic acid-binding protein